MPATRFSSSITTAWRPPSAPVLGAPLDPGRLAGATDAASRAAERAAGLDRDRARVVSGGAVPAAGVPAGRMGEVRGVPPAVHDESHLWCRVAPGHPGGARSLRARGLRLGVVSNSDGRVEEALVAAGLRECFDVVLDSALVGVEKPDPTIFRAALAALGVAAAEALYVGDLYQVDVVGARAAGMEGCCSSGRASPAPTAGNSRRSTALADDLLNGGRP